MPNPVETGDGLVALTSCANHWHLTPIELRALLNERGVQIHQYSVSGRKVELVNEREANRAILAHVTPKALVASESWTPLSDRLELQAAELEKLRTDMAAVMRGLGVKA